MPPHGPWFPDSNTDFTILDLKEKHDLNTVHVHAAPSTPPPTSPQTLGPKCSCVYKHDARRCAAQRSGQSIQASSRRGVENDGLKVWGVRLRLHRVLGGKSSVSPARLWAILRIAASQLPDVGFQQCELVNLKCSATLVHSKENFHKTNSCKPPMGVCFKQLLQSCWGSRACATRI